jgi:hypothetical protein
VGFPLDYFHDDFIFTYFVWWYSSLLSLLLHFLLTICVHFLKNVLSLYSIKPNVLSCNQRINKTSHKHFIWNVFWSWKKGNIVFLVFLKRIFFFKWGKMKQIANRQRKRKLVSTPSLILVLVWAFRIGGAFATGLADVRQKLVEAERILFLLKLNWATTGAGRTRTISSTKFFIRYKPELNKYKKTNEFPVWSIKTLNLTYLLVFTSLSKSSPYKSWSRFFVGR